MLISALILMCALLFSGFGTLIGFGGGIFMIPLLVLAFQVQMPFAVGTVALALFPAALIATAFNSKAGHIDYKTAFFLEIPTLFGTLLGAYLTSVLSVQGLELIFALFLLYFSTRTLIAPRKGSSPPARLIHALNRVGPKLKRVKDGHAYEVGLPAALLFGGSSGVIAGLFGIGGGFLKTPIMIHIFKMPPRLAVATALLMIVFTSLTSSLSHASLGHIDWTLAVPLLIGFSLGATGGNLLKKRISETHTEKMISVGLFLAGMSLLIHSL